MNMLLILTYLLMKVSMDVIFALIIAARGKKLNNLFSVTFRGTQAFSVLLENYPTQDRCLTHSLCWRNAFLLGIAKFEKFSSIKGGLNRSSIIGLINSTEEEENTHSSFFAQFFLFIKNQQLK